MKHNYSHRALHLEKRSSNHLIQTLYNQQSDITLHFFHKAYQYGGTKL